jgi:hypothetical protein
MFRSIVEPWTWVWHCQTTTPKMHCHRALGKIDHIYGHRITVAPHKDCLAAIILAGLLANLSATIAGQWIAE